MPTCTEPHAHALTDARLLHMLDSALQDPRAPIGTDDRLICHACRAIVHQMHHKLKARPTRSHADVLELLENMCDVSNLKIYEYIPPKMRKGCNDFLGKHSGEHYERGTCRAHACSSPCAMRARRAQRAAPTHTTASR